MKRFVRYFSAFTLMLCLLTAGPLFAQGKVDINSADAQGLMSLKGIGESKAKAIVKYRQMNGPFTSLDDLKSVPGVGDKIVQDNKSRIAVGKGTGKKGGASKAKKEMTGSKDKAKKGTASSKDKAQKGTKSSSDKAKKGMKDTASKSKKDMKGTASKSKKSMQSTTDKTKKTKPKTKSTTK